MNKWLESALAWLVPGTCILCRGPAPSGCLCRDCAGDLPWVTAACTLCGAEIAGGQICQLCAESPPPTERTVIAMTYNGAARRLVHELKFRGALPVAELLGERLAAAVVATGGPLPDLLIPIPLHPGRLRQRGFNQALEIARVVGRRLGCPLAPLGIARRIRITAAQSSLGGAGARRRNMAGAFTASAAVAGTRVAIVDDVITTGATVFDLAGALQAAGAVGVESWVCCRAARPAERRRGAPAQGSGVEVRHR